MTFQPNIREKRGIIHWLFSPTNYIIEILLLLLWTLWVGRSYLNFDPNAWPFGREYGLNIHSHYVWEYAKQCGICMLWNGTENGGYPAFAELQGAVLHPVVILSTLLTGVVNGSKLTLLFSLFSAGIAQWWLAKNMKVGRLARLWSAGMAVVGGHLAARMELGLVTLVLSTSACSLAIASGVDLALTGKRRSAVLFALTLACVIVSGQGYMQMGFALCVLPVFLILIIQKREEGSQKLWKEFLLAGGLALLLAGVFLIPFLHFSPNVDKATDPAFGSAQSLAYVPLNLVIDDMNYYNSEVLKPTVFTSLYANYIGWIPVILAALTIHYKPRRSNRLWIFFLVVIGLSYLVASALPFKALVSLLPGLAQFRFQSYTAGLANPIILCLAACGLDGLLKTKWPGITLAASSEVEQPAYHLYLNVVPVLIVVLLLFSLRSAYMFGQQWLGILNDSGYLMKVSEKIKTQNSEWISVPIGDHYWNISLLQLGMKIGNANLPWWWKDRSFPPAELAISRDPAVSTNFVQLQKIDDLNIYVYPDNEYAYIQNGVQKIPCNTRSEGGNITVDCPENPGGTLFVMENSFPGWVAYIGAARTKRVISGWLAMEVPADTHHFSFLYRPWDVWLGISLTLTGLVLCIYFWIKGRSAEAFMKDVPVGEHPGEQ